MYLDIINKVVIPCTTCKAYACRSVVRDSSKRKVFIAQIKLDTYILVNFYKRATVEAEYKPVGRWILIPGIKFLARFCGVKYSDKLLKSCNPLATSLASFPI